MEWMEPSLPYTRVWIDPYLPSLPYTKDWIDPYLPYTGAGGKNVVLYGGKRVPYQSLPFKERVTCNSLVKKEKGGWTV